MEINRILSLYFKTFLQKIINSSVNEYKSYCLQRTRTETEETKRFQSVIRNTGNPQIKTIFSKSLFFFSYKPARFYALTKI